MRVKSNKALRRSARLARRASLSAVAALPAQASVLRRPGLRLGAANSIAAAVTGILWGSGGLYGTAGTAYAQEAAPAPASAQASESLQEVVVTANAQGGVKKLDASYSIVAVDLEQLKQANPKSSADILKVSTNLVAVRIYRGREKFIEAYKRANPDE